METIEQWASRTMKYVIKIELDSNYETYLRS